METTQKIAYRGKDYKVVMFQLEDEYFWRVENYTDKTDFTARKLQSRCGFNVGEYGFSDFGIIDKTAYWESRSQSNEELEQLKENALSAKNNREFADIQWRENRAQDLS